MYKIAIIAGEISGDLIGAKLIKALQQQIQFDAAGVGGHNMIEAGFKTIFPIHDLSIIGFFEVLPKIPIIFKRLQETIDFIATYKPDILITIDSPGFNFRLVKRLRKIKVKFPIIHYVAPTVWAYNPERALKIATLYDHLLTILPFEKQYFDSVNLPCTYVGHPVMEEILPLETKEQLKEKYGYTSDECLISITPGSRVSELNFHLPILLQVIRKLALNNQNVKFVLLTLPHLLQECIKFVKKFALEQYVRIEADQTAKKELMYSSDAALIKSGTVAIECAKMQVPMLLFYRTSFLSYMVIKHKIKIAYVGILNFMANKEIIPELLQQDFNVNAVSSALEKLLHSEGALQVKQLAPYLKQLKNLDNQKPSEAAAAVVSSLLRK